METTSVPTNPAAVVSADVRRQSRDVVAHLQKSPMFRKYQQAFEAATGLPLGLRALGGFAVPMGESRRRNPLCGLLAGTNSTCAGCLRLQQQLEDRIQGGEAATAQCHAGLTETAVAIRIGERVVGCLQTGQVLLRAPTAARIRALCRNFAVPLGPEAAAGLPGAYRRTRVLSAEQYRSIVRLLEVFAQHLAIVSNQMLVAESFQELPVIARAKAYIAEHQHDQLSLPIISTAAGLSPSYFCKLFRTVTGTNLMDYVARVRVEAVKQCLLNPHVRISEAAYACGFQSLSQFNRTFRRVAGEQPNRFRTRLPRTPSTLSCAA